MHLCPWLRSFAPKDSPPEVRDRGRVRDGSYYGFEEILITEDDKIGAYNDYVMTQGHPSLLGQGDEGKVEDGLNPIPEELHQTYWVGMNSCKKIATHDFKKPLFLWSSFVDPHHPFEPIDEFASLYEKMPISEKTPMGSPSSLMHQNRLTGWAGVNRTVLRTKMLRNLPAGIMPWFLLLIRKSEKLSIA